MHRQCPWGPLPGPCRRSTFRILSRPTWNDRDPMTVATGMAETQSPAQVDFWFDLICPWAWITSRWLHEVAEQRPIQPRWHVMSLSVLNEDKADLSERYRQRLAPAGGRSGVHRRRAEVRLRRARPLYTALGSRFHNEQQPRERATIEAALAEGDCPPSSLTRWIGRVRRGAARIASQRHGTGRVRGRNARDLRARLVLLRARRVAHPRGAAAARLWDGVLLVAGTEGFFELKRSRTRDPIFT